MCDKKYQFEETIYGFRVYTKERPLVANIWIFDTDSNNEFMTVYSGPKNTFLLHRLLLKNEWLRTQYLDNTFVYDDGKTIVPILTNHGDYIQILNFAPKYNAFIRFVLTGHVCFPEFIRSIEQITS